MYPRVSDLFSDFLGFDLPFPVCSCGLMVAVAILTATGLLRRELDRMYAAGQVPSVKVEVKDKTGRKRMESMSPSVLAWTVMLLAAVFGILGSKLFYFFEEWDRFVADPLGIALSPAGLTFYGGLICAGIAIGYYVRKKGIPLGRMMDATAPGLILAYGIGRIGCYLAGDGDWGVCSSLADKPGWLPGFLWSETFPHNVIGPDMQPVEVISYTTDRAQVLGFPADICAGANGVYPTMLYEFAVCALLAGALWLLRKHPYRAGWLFSIYLLFTGVERFVIETIRLNPDVIWGLSQAQLISIVMFAAGLVGLALTTRRAAAPPAAPAAAPAPAPPVATAA